MEHSLDVQIRYKLMSYLLGEISLQSFEDWFVPSSWNVDQSKNQDAINMVYEIELRLAEFSNGHRSEEELKDFLRPLVANYRVDLVAMRYKLSSNALIEHYRWLPVSYRISNAEAS